MGRQVAVGTETINKNGYRLTKTDDGWRLTHHLIAEKKIGREIDSARERVVFVDRNNKNLDPDNIEVRPIKRSKADRIRQIEDRIEALERELRYLKSSS